MEEGKRGELCVEPSGNKEAKPTGELSFSDFGFCCEKWSDFVRELKNMTYGACKLLVEILRVNVFKYRC
jgi:hypothetical protein